MAFCILLKTRGHSGQSGTFSAFYYQLISGEFRCGGTSAQVAADKTALSQRAAVIARLRGGALSITVFTLVRLRLGRE